MITIGIVLYNEEKHISLLEKNLALLANRSGIFKVVLVDNASGDSTPEHLLRLQTQFGLHVIFRSENNMGSARQDVVRASTTEWIGFIDGDCEIDQQWLDRAQELSESLELEVAAFGGPWHPEGGSREWYKDLFASPLGHFSLPQLSFLNGRAPVAHIPTANVIYRKESLESIGGFREHFVRVGEDLDVSHRLAGRGQKLLMIADMPVGHYLPANTFDWAKKIFIYGRGRVHVAICQRSFNDRILILPVGFLVVMVSSLVLGAFWIAGLYLASVLAVAVVSRPRSGILRLFVLLTVTHFSYALGMAFEWLRQGFRSVLQLKQHVPLLSRSPVTAEKAGFAQEKL